MSTRVVLVLFWFLRLCSRLHLSKFWYTRTVRLGTLGCFRFHVWDRVFCRLTGNYHWSVYAISRWPDWYGDRLFFQIQVCKDSVQINHCASEFYSQTQGATDYNVHRSVMGGGGGGGGVYRHTDQNNGSLRVYFVVQIPPLHVVPGRSA